VDARLQRRVQRYGWDLAAEVYEEGWRAALAPAHARLLALADLRPGERVLDVACGTGVITLAAARAVHPGGAVAGVDVSERMVELARARAAAESLEHVALHRMDAELLAFDDAAFDVALDALGLMYLPDPHAALLEMHRVLRPAGRAVAAVWGARARCGWAEIFPIVQRRVHSEVCPLFFQLGNGDALAFALRRAGFAAVELERVPTTLHYATAADALTAALDAGPVALAASRFDAAMRASAEAEYLASIEPYRAEGDGYAIPGEFVVARGVRESLGPS
jgi:ubiquinone/menaquinone biosynthesis C-methylase UbiE